VYEGKLTKTFVNKETSQKTEVSGFIERKQMDECADFQISLKFGDD
jgi:hypothetical protein